MAGIITHLVIAREMIKLLPKGTIKEEGLFYEGSFAPDAIHAREGFIREDKKHTHLRDNIPDKDFILEENRTLFYSRVADFILENQMRECGLLDLYRGYVVHLLTDELFVITIREEFCEIMAGMGIAQHDIEFFYNIVSDLNRIDDILVENYEGMDEIRKRLEKIKPYPIEGLLSENEIRDCNNWLLHNYFVEKHELLAPVYISYERTLDFIKMTAENIVIRLSEGGSLPRML